MIRNFFFVFLRTLTRQLSYSLINIVGLAIGIACSLVIFLFVYGEWSYDRGFPNSERIYKVGISFFNIGNFGNGPEALLNVLPSEYAGIEAATRVRRERGLAMEAAGKSFRENNVYYTDSSFFRVFGHEFVYGDDGAVLQAPNEAVVTESIALKYFGTSDAVGKKLAVGNDKKEFYVSAVVRDLPFNATVRADVFLSNHSVLENQPVWSSASFYNFVLVRADQTRADLEAALDRVWENHVFPEAGRMMGFTDMEAYRTNANAIRFHLHALRDVYLRSNLSHELTAGGSETNIYVFSAISLFILTLAAVNFINLTTARASRRAKEVGIRKTMGTSRNRLVVQFLSESVLISTLAMVLALVLAELFLVAFTYVTGSPLLDTIWSNTATVLLFIAFSIVVGICSGLYPAFYLTSFNPVKVLKGNVSASGGVRFRNVLVVFQFGVSMILIVCAIVVQQQLHFVQTKELGFDQENVITIDQGYLLDESKAHAFKDELDRYSGVVKSAFHAGEPGSKRFMSFYVYQAEGAESSLTIQTYLGDASYPDLMGVKLLQGRTFDPNLPSDTSSIILNEAGVAALGLPENPIGAVINNTDRVIGVVSDFHWESLHHAIGPLAIRMNRNHGEIGFKVRPESITGFLQLAEQKWKELVPNEPFRYHFVDGNFEDLLKKDRVFGKAINLFTMLAIFISCLGLYGLSAFTAEQRTREIGIRKVLGATSTQIVLMLNRKFTLLVVTAIVISIPLSVWLISRWLDGFAYRIDPGPGIFVLAIGLALVTAWVTVSFHSIRASWTNPGDSLKYE